MPFPTLPSLPNLPTSNGQQGPQSESTPPPIHVKRFARNGLLPHAQFETKVGGAINHAARIRRKNLLSWAAPIDDVPTGQAATRTRWRAAAHTGPVLSKIKAYVLLARQLVTVGGGTGSNPTVTLAITNADESTTYGSASFSAGASASSPTDVPSEWSLGELTVSGVSADTDIYIRLDDEGGGRLISATVYEEGLPIWNGNGYPVSQVAATSPIYDARRAAMMPFATNYWKRGAAHLWNWTADDQSSPLTVIATTLNVIDGTSTSVSTSTPGATLDLRYCRTRSKSTVPCVFAAYASMSAGSADVLLKDSGGNTLATLTVNSSTAAWYTTTVDLDASLAKYDVLASNAGAGTLSVGAFSLYQYEA